MFFFNKITKHQSILATKFDESIYLPQLSLYDNLEMEIAVFVDESMYRMYSRNFTESYAQYKLTEYVKTVMNDVRNVSKWRLIDFIPIYIMLFYVLDSTTVPQPVFDAQNNIQSC